MINLVNKINFVDRRPEDPVGRVKGRMGVCPIPEGWTGRVAYTDKVDSDWGNKGRWDGSRAV